VAAKPKSKSTKPKTTKPKTEYDRTWIPKPPSAVSKVKIKTNAVPMPKVSLKGIQEIKQPRTRQA